MMKCIIDFDEIDIFRKATPSDITEGNIVYLISGNHNEIIKKTIDEVLRPDDAWKAFCADDGCRYGLDNLWVLKSGVELQKKIENLEDTIKRINKITNYLDALE